MAAYSDRFRDFQVREVDADGNVARLTTLEPPQLVRGLAGIPGPQTPLPPSGTQAGICGAASGDTHGPKPTAANPNEGGVGWGWRLPVTVPRQHRGSQAQDGVPEPQEAHTVAQSHGPLSSLPLPPAGSTTPCLQAASHARANVAAPDGDDTAAAAGDAAAGGSGGGGAGAEGEEAAGGEEAAAPAAPAARLSAATPRLVAAFAAVAGDKNGELLGQLLQRIVVQLQPAAAEAAAAEMAEVAAAAPPAAAGAESKAAEEIKTEAEKGEAQAEQPQATTATATDATATATAAAATAGCVVVSGAGGRLSVLLQPVESKDARKASQRAPPDGMGLH